MIGNIKKYKEPKNETNKKEEEINMPLCLYCNREKEEDQFTREHILPREIGGALTPTNPFVIHNVCERCNTLSGLFIDGPFVKSWLMHNQRANNAKKHIKLSNYTVLPLIYMGILEDFAFGDKICEHWLGPTGDTIYHFHQPYPKEPDVPPMVGVPTTAILKKIDLGFAFLFVRSNNPDWHPAIFNSFVNQFKGSKLFLGNGPKPPIPGFEDIPVELQALYSKLVGIQGKRHEVKVTLGVEYSHRFLSKIALGLGSLTLNPSFKQSKSATLLRQVMWSKDITTRQKIEVPRTSFPMDMNGVQNWQRFLTWQGGHAIIVINLGGKLALYMNFYEVAGASIMISNEPEHWSGRIKEGIVYVISPGLQKYVGPLNIGALLAHKIVDEYEVPELVKLEQEMAKFGSLPPFDI